MKWDYGFSEDIVASGPGLLIACEGNFQYGNATLSYYDPATATVQNEVFFRANGMKLGDVAQSMTLHSGRVWIVVNNSHVVFAIDPDTFRETGRIENFTSPRYIHFVSDTKAYVTQLWDNRIAIVNPQRYEITGYIEVPGMSASSGSTEQMVQLGDYVYCNCWSYQNTILKIDTRTDRVVDRLTVGIQPAISPPTATDACGCSPTAASTAIHSGRNAPPSPASTPARSPSSAHSVSTSTTHQHPLPPTPPPTPSTG